MGHFLILVGGTYLINVLSLPFFRLIMKILNRTHLQISLCNFGEQVLPFHSKPRLSQTFLYLVFITFLIIVLLGSPSKICCVKSSKKIHNISSSLKWPVALSEKKIRKVVWHDVSWTEIYQLLGITMFFRFLVICDQFGGDRKFNNSCMFPNLWFVAPIFPLMTHTLNYIFGFAVPHRYLISFNMSHLLQLVQWVHQSVQVTCFNLFFLFSRLFALMLIVVPTCLQLTL